MSLQNTHGWIGAAEAALLGKETTGIEVEVLERKPPPVFDAAAVRALTSPLLAAFMWAAAVLREQLAQHPLDALTLLLRVLALALSVRALSALLALWRRLQVRAALGRYGLVLTDGGLLYRNPDGDVVVAREHILQAREQGDWRERSGRRWAEVYVITTPSSGRTHIALPPVFLDTSGILAERLMRWIAQDPDQGKSARRELAADQNASERLPSKLWDDVRAGQRPAGVTVVPQGSAWLQRGPYVSILLGLAVLSGYLRLSAAARAAIGVTGPLAFATALGLVPLIWWWLTRRQVAARGGIALLLTGAEALMRTRAGVHRFRWNTVSAIDVERRTTWSLLRGAAEERSLVLRRSNDGGDVRYQEAFLGVPLEVALTLCEAYRRAAVQPATPSGEPAAHGCEASTPAS